MSGNSTRSDHEPPQPRSFCLAPRLRSLCHREPIFPRRNVHIVVLPLLFAHVLLCCACDLETVKWQNRPATSSKSTTRPQKAVKQKRRIVSDQIQLGQGVAGCRVANRPKCPSSWRTAQGFDLIPVSVFGEGVQDGGGVEQKEHSRNNKETHDVWIENVLLGCAQNTSIIKKTCALSLSPSMSHTHVLCM